MYSITKLSVPKQDQQAFLANALSWADGFSHFSYFTSNEAEVKYWGFTNMLCVDAVKTISCSKDSLEQLDVFANATQGWLCGSLAYNLKNEIESLSSRHEPTIPFSNLSFFQPRYIVLFGEEEIEIKSWAESSVQVFDKLRYYFSERNQNFKSYTLEAKVDREKFKEKIEKIKQLISEGEVYELNYCIEFTAHAPKFDYLSTFLALNDISPMPFACLAKTPEGIVLSASPERYLKRADSKLIGQPIKGTIARNIDAKLDADNIQSLQQSTKERAENMMIVDLTRSDFAKCAVTGSVKVEEMFGIYSYKYLHQMISTVTATVAPNIKLSELIEATFPMGSMTGAPKIRAMQWIDEIEHSNRGLYSGALGWINPDGDFDFNVVIRSILYSPQSNIISFHVGSAITADSNPDLEYEECFLKAKAIFEVLEGKK